ncbi:hypothetical protein BKA93DRAFT_826992 [Sparassis latifolia]
MPLNSLEVMTATPSNWAAVFGPTLYYRPPPNPLARFLWRKRIMFETTMGLSGIEPWERVLVSLVVCVVSLLLFQSFRAYIPQILAIIQRRSAFYFFGYEPDKGAAVDRIVAGWVAGNASGDL